MSDDRQKVLAKVFASDTPKALLAYMKTYAVNPGQIMYSLSASKTDRPDLVETVLGLLRKKDRANLGSVAKQAAWHGNAKTVAVLMPHIADVDELDSFHGDTILATAVRYEQVECVAAALEGGASPDVAALRESGPLVR